jgi:hypothetical protein
MYSNTRGAVGGRLPVFAFAYWVVNVSAPVSLLLDIPLGVTTRTNRWLAGWPAAICTCAVTEVAVDGSGGLKSPDRLFAVRRVCESLLRTHQQDGRHPTGPPVGFGGSHSGARRKGFAGAVPWRARPCRLRAAVQKKRNRDGRLRRDGLRDGSMKTELPNYDW